MDKEILLLKTIPHNYNDIKGISLLLDNHARIAGWNIDLDDCDKILRIESKGIKVGEVIHLLHKIGIWAEELLD
jgi:hypothetical protein